MDIDNYIHKYKDINNINKIEIKKNYDNIDIDKILKDVEEDFKLLNNLKKHVSNNIYSLERNDLKINDS
jgi:hypothetical protein